MGGSYTRFLNHHGPLLTSTTDLSLKDNFPILSQGYFIVAVAH